MDGRLLALAREEKERVRLRALDEDARRQRIAYGRIPELRAIDTRLAALVSELAQAVWGGGRRPEEIRDESLALQAERAELLTAHGFRVDWLDGAWECPKCHDTGYVEGRMCACLRALYDRQRAISLSALLKLGNESFDTFDLTYYSDVPDPNTGISPREQMKLVYDFCLDYAGHFGKSSINLLFRGGTGLGKTFLSACIARVVSDKGFSVVYETVVDALAVFETQKFRPDDAAGDDTERLLGCDLLILDDLGTEMVTEFTKSALYTLINTRLIRRKKTIVSTNLDWASLRAVYTPQISSRLEGEYQDLPFTGRDIRLIRKERGFS